MVITTYKTFTDGLTALSVTGVTRVFTEPPTSIGTADLPAMYIRIPRGEEGAMTFQTSGGWPTLTCDLVIVVEAVGQNTQSANYAATIELMDNLSSALRLASIGRSALVFNIDGDVQTEIAGTSYWAVVATISGH